jgi:hypothetical protein
MKSLIVEEFISVTFPLRLCTNFITESIAMSSHCPLFLLNFHNFMQVTFIRSHLNHLWNVFFCLKILQE